MEMRLVRVLALVGLILGGGTACKDHNPTVVFTGADAGGDGKSETGAPLDGGGSRDGGSAVEVAIATDLGNQIVDAPLADGPASIDSAGTGLDGSGGLTLDVGVDSYALHDGGGAGG
jgi:hypothetical protein